MINVDFSVAVGDYIKSKGAESKYTVLIILSQYNYALELPKVLNKAVQEVVPLNIQNSELCHFTQF